MLELLLNLHGLRLRVINLDHIVLDHNSSTTVRTPGILQSLLTFCVSVLPVCLVIVVPSIISSIGIHV